MVKKVQYTSAAVKAIFCLDSMADFDYKGRVYIGTDRIGYGINGVNDLLKVLECVFDHYKFPQASHENRSFLKAKGNIDKKRKEFMENKNIENSAEHTGEKATFIVQVQFRQNSTWQGTVQWVEKGVTQRFRSELELIKLMNEAADEKELATW